jgi:predicted metallopeptidase
MLCLKWKLSVLYIMVAIVLLSTPDTVAVVAMEVSHPPFSFSWILHAFKGKQN